MANAKSSAEIEAAEFVENTPIPEEYRDGVKEFVSKIISHPAFNNTEYKWSLADFELGSRLGRGKFGRVFMAREKQTGYPVAMKTLEKHEIVKGHHERQVLREIEIQSRLKHPNVLELMTWFHDEYRIYLVVEFAAKVGNPPFESKTSDETYSRIRKIDIKFPPNVSPGAMDLISTLLRKTPENRLTLEDVMKHSWTISNMYRF